MSHAEPRETSDEPTEPGYHWARRDGALIGEIIEVRKSWDGQLVALIPGESSEDWESLHAFFLFYGPLTSPWADLGS